MEFIGWMISGCIVLAAIISQLVSHFGTKKNRDKYKNLFPENPASAVSAFQDKETNVVQIKVADAVDNKEFLEIVKAINNYLKKNRGATDFAILKDITDRNSDTLEAQIEATAPIPTYIGLCGTLLGIVCGVCIMAFGGGIDALTNYSAEGGADLGADSIKALLQGVSVAMITTLSGVLLSIIGSIYSKKVYKNGEHRKNLFLNWMQGELLPQMNSNMVSTLDILQRNLTNFNNSFAENSQKLSRVFDGINASYKGQAEVLKLVERMKVNDIATANVRVLQELQKCTAEISSLQEFIRQSNQYLSSVDSLNKNLSDHHDRTQLIEKMSEFFMDEIRQIETRKSAISEAVGKIDLQLQAAFKDLSNHTSAEYQELKVVAAKEHLDLLKAVEDQKKALNAKLEETTTIVAELKNLVDVKESMGLLVAKSEEQNSQIEKLLKSNTMVSTICSKQNDLLRELSETIRQMSFPGSESNTVIYKPEPFKLPIVFKILAILTSVVIVGTCAFFIVKTLL